MLLLPVVAEFRPDLILVSAGFDAVDKDPVGELCVLFCGEGCVHVF
jgi:acetoin utilization deacetylase AcuC-like enzyme